MFGRVDNIGLKASAGDLRQLRASGARCLLSLTSAGAPDMRISRVMLLGAALAVPVIVHAQSLPGWQQTLQGLLTGTQSQDTSEVVRR